MSNRACFAFTMFFAALAIGQAAAARADFTFSDGSHTYQLVTTPRTWLAAANDAKSRTLVGATGQLAQVDSAAESTAIVNALLAGIPASSFGSTRAPDGGQGAYVWLGGTDRVTEGAWIWDGDGNGVGTQFWQGTGATGSSVGGLYRNWGILNGNQREPDNSNNQDALGLSLDGWPFGLAGQWNDVNENNSLYYVVEFAAVPEPGTASMAVAGAIAIGLAAAQRRRREANSARFE